MHIRCFSARAAAGALLAVAVLIGACGESNPRQVPDTGLPLPQTCLPGQADPCECGPGVRGVAVCNPDGVSYGTCTCASASMPGSTSGATSGGTTPTTTGLVVGEDAAVGGGSTGTGTVGSVGGDVSPGMDAAVGPTPDPLAHDIRISEVALYQAVKVSLAQEGEPVIDRNAPVIAGKEGFLRVFVEPLAGFADRELQAELTLSSGGDTETQTVTQRIGGPSSDPDLDSTINFDIGPGVITTDTQWSVALREVAAEGGAGTVDPDARFPSNPEAVEAMGARDAGPLRVMLVPYRYMADGSERLPAYDDQQLELFRSYLHAFYPVTEVIFEIHEPVDYEVAVGPNSNWERWLDDHCALRTQESPDPKVLYYGIMSPRPDARSYGGGVYGISYLPGPAANYGRCSVGVGFAGETAASVMAHELGHSLGLPHAPCGVDGGPYPYPNGIIGSWGFGLSSRTLKDPDEFHDVMSYCNPVFISDYNFQKLFERVRYLNLQFDRVYTSESRQAYVRILRYSDGRTEVVGRHELTEPPGGDEEKRSVELLDEGGESLGVRDGYFLPLAEGTGGVWFVPDVGQRTVVLDDGERVSL